MQVFMAVLFIITKKVETTQMYTNIQMDTQNVVYSYNGILLSRKKEGSADTATVWPTPENLMPSQRSHMLYDFISVKCPELVNP